MTEVYNKELLEDNYLRHEVFGLSYAWLDDYKYSKRMIDDNYVFCLEDISQELGEQFLDEKYFEIPDCFEFISSTAMRGFFNQDFKFKIKADGLIGLPMGMFLDNKNITDISLKNCKFIGISAFKGTESLESVYIPNIEIIHSKAFKNSNLKYIDITNASVIESEAFYNCNHCKFSGKDYNNLSILSKLSFYNSSIELMNAPNLTSISSRCFENSNIKEFLTGLKLNLYYTVDDIFRNTVVNKFKFGVYYEN